ncbi:hypothetical protein EDD86DRAFT_215066 [Gorgonomyces haynaldii]|nr:hypothetical protein EDD86DRAFT_215066 [Gorgonomyces haynaldii]
MPPKKQQQKAKEKAIEDKTFGLKNKNRSTKVKQFVNQVQQNIKNSGSREEKLAQKQKEEKAKQKLLEEQRKKEMQELFKQAIVQPKVPFGVDPKTVMCAFFKAGQCQKGAKCKYSHDLNVERKSAKANIYQDMREEEKTMENWDQDKLEKAVAEKDVGRENLNKQTDIVCKYFIEAIETRKYGWFWECPNGGKECKYRHALPPGFVLKKKETEEEKRARLEEEKENALTIEDFLEVERHKLGADTTPVTAESFAKWKAERKAREAKEEEDLLKKKADEFKKMKAGMKSGMVFSGKDLFDFNPDWAAQGDEGAMDDYERQASDVEDEKQDDVQVENIDSELFNEEELQGLDSESDVE